MDNQILRDLFKGCLGAWKELGEQVPEACEIPEAGDIKELMGTIRKCTTDCRPTGSAVTDA